MKALCLCRREGGHVVKFHEVNASSRSGTRLRSTLTFDLGLQHGGFGCPRGMYISVTNDISQLHAAILDSSTKKATFESIFFIIYYCVEVLWPSEYAVELSMWLGMGRNNLKRGR